MRFLDRGANRPRTSAGGQAADREPLRFEALYPRCLDAVFSFVAHRVHNRADADDLTVEIFEAAWESLAKFRGDGSPRAWLLGIARRKVAQAARRFEKGRCLELSEAGLSPEERERLELLLVADPERAPDNALLRAEAQEVMRRLLAGLPEPQREALLLRFEDGLSAEEIGQVMGRSVAAVNSLLQRARATIFREGKEYFLG